MVQKRLSAPKVYPIQRKGKKFVISTRPGPHSKETSIPLGVILRDVLGYAKTMKEIKMILNTGQVMVDGRVRKDHRYPVGLFDVLGFKNMNKYYRMVPFRKGFKLVEVKKSESGTKLCRIENKTVLKGGKIQLNLSDGKNIIVEDGFSTKDSVLLQIPDLKVKQHIPRKKGSLGLFIRGVNRGRICTVKDFRKTRGPSPNLVTVDMDGKEMEVDENLIFIVGEKKPVITVGEQNE
ncbi:MAG: 30S ribosomal protein S4e [Candidatus Aenigmatarchaeota archaeon]|nr:MAG: 30S ribosomal protein S4e [Candidatus Aenigmarchaeota archaeon]